MSLRLGDEGSGGAIAVSRADRNLATLALIVATALQAGDATIVNVALPQLERDLGGGIGSAPG